MLDMRKWKDETYMETMREKIPFINTEIVKLPQPIDLYSAYGAYNFGIYKNTTKSLKRAYNFSNIKSCIVDGT